MTATYLARADQLEIKIAQGSKPGEGGQLPGRKATAYIAALRRGQPGQSVHQPAAAPRHLLDRGPRPAHRRPAGDQPGGAHRREARRVARRRHDRRGRGQGRRDVHPPVRPRRRDRRVAAVLDQARRGALGARPRRGPPGPAPQRPARPGRAAHRRRPADRPRPARRRAARRRGVRVRDRRARGRRLRHGPPVPPRHLPDRHRDPARGPAREVHRHARDGRALLPGPRRGPPPRAGRRSARARSARSSARAGGCSGRSPAARAELEPVIGAAPWDADAGPPRRSGRCRPGPAATRRPPRSRSGSPPPSATRARSAPPGCACRRPIARSVPG